MKPEIIKKVEYKELEIIRGVLDKGGVIVIPSETVYGLAGNPYLEESINQIYTIKNRPLDNPLIIHSTNYNMIQNIIDLSKHSAIQKYILYILYKSFCPGPITFVLYKNNNCKTIGNNMDSVCIRFPNNIIFRNIINHIRYPLAAPSANLSGLPSGTNINDIYKDFENKLDYIVDGGDSFHGLESTIINITSLWDEYDINNPNINNPDINTSDDKDLSIDSNLIDLLNSSGPTTNGNNDQSRELTSGLTNSFNLISDLTSNCSVECLLDRIEILRHGSVTREMINEVLRRDLFGSNTQVNDHVSTHVSTQTSHHTNAQTSHHTDNNPSDHISAQTSYHTDNNPSDHISTHTNPHTMPHTNTHMEAKADKRGLICPGTKYKHYSPSKDIHLLENKTDSYIIDYIIDRINRDIYGSNDKIGLFSNMQIYNKMEHHWKYIDHKRTDGPIDILGHDLFKEFRRMDRNDIAFIIIIAIRRDGLGSAIMDRIERATTYFIN
eukprot:GHVP01026395.1.p1 GENE.GHVP01026395.1~~GHVP01026395.1.p1  ORF type:complete len:495 (+),score=40.09 GHVP01026395.1:197-1681(+)